MDFAHAAHAVADAVTPRRNSPVVGVLDQVLTWGLRLTIFIIPLVLSPWTSEMFEFGKQLLLFGMVVALATVWLARIVVAREVRTSTSPLGWAVLALLLATGAATVFSVDWITSTLGFYGRFNGGLVSMVAYALTYVLVLNVARDAGEVRWLLGSWLAGIGLGAFVLLLQLVGIHLIPLAVAAAPSFTPLGRSLNGALLPLAASLPLALLFAREARSATLRWAALGLSILIPVLAFLIDYQLGWVSLLVASTLWLAIVFWKNESVGFQWTVVPALALLLAVIGWPLRTPAITQLNIPVEVNLSLKASWQIATQNVRVNPLFGTGPETFIYGFSKYKPENFNDSDFWAFRFDKAASEFAQTLATTGILGLAAQLAVVAMGLWLSVQILRDREEDDWYLRAALASAFIVMLIGQVFYFTSTVSALGWWFVLALLARLSSRRERNLSLAHSPRASFASSLGLAVIVLVAVVGWFGVVRIFTADAAYAHAQNVLRTGNLDEAESSLVRSVRLNPLRDVYYIGLAQVRLALANRAAQQPLAETDTEKQAQFARLQGYLRSSVEAAQAATTVGRENVANWEALGSIYRGTALYAQDAERWMVESFQNAILREPKNPALYTELGRAYLIAAARNRQAAAAAKDKTKLESDIAALLTKALEQFDQAIKLKANYTPAHFNQALVLEQQGKLNEAISKLESMRRFNPQDIDVLYELGSLYYGKSRYAEAEDVFTTITKLVPNHTNAQYSLALTLEQQGKRDQAITQLEALLKAIPEGNESRATVQQRLDSLRRGEGIAPSNPEPSASQP